MPAAKAAAAKVAGAAAKAASKAAPAATPTKVQRPPKLYPVSPTLRAFLGGVAETSRTNTVKQLWDYIREHRLQNPDNGTEIICDEKLKLVLGKDKVNYREIFGLISPHFPKKEGSKS